MMLVRVRAVEIGSFSVALLKLLGPGGGFECAQRAEQGQITVHRVKIPQAWVRNSRLQLKVTLHISGVRARRLYSIRSADMTAIHSQAPHGGWRRISRRPRPASGLVQRALAAVRDWRGRLQDRNRLSVLDERTLRDSGICRNDELHVDREQIERDAWLETLRFPPF
jgi:uncharacterized protein YjiS (DUF1127 family)